jgi:ribosome-associated protein
VSTQKPPAEVDLAVAAALDKQADGVTLLDLDRLGAFTGYFLVCSGASARQVDAIADEVEARLDARGRHPLHREGRDRSEWVLLDYGDFVVHIFSETARHYYDLERLWRHAPRRVFSSSDSAAGAARP